MTEKETKAFTALEQNYKQTAEKNIELISKIALLEKEKASLLDDISSKEFNDSLKVSGVQKEFLDIAIALHSSPSVNSIEDLKAQFPHMFIIKKKEEK